MFLGMQDFDFAQIQSVFQNLITFAQKFMLGDAAAQGRSQPNIAEGAKKFLVGPNFFLSSFFSTLMIISQF